MHLLQEFVVFSSLKQLSLVEKTRRSRNPEIGREFSGTIAFIRVRAVGISALDWGVILAYLLGITWLGLWVGRRVKNEGDYFVGGRKFGKVFSMMHQFATGTHSDQPVGVAGKAYEVGLAGIWYQWLWLFITPFYWLIAPLFRRLRYVTTGDFFEHRYGAHLGKLYALVGITIFMLNIGIMLNGTGRTIQAMTGDAVPSLWVIIAMSVMFVVYSYVGGIVAAVITDTIQGVLIIILSFMLMPFTISKVGGFAGLHAALSPDKFSLVAPHDITLFFVVMTIINGLVNIVTQPHVNQTCGVAKNEVDAAVGFTFGNFIKRFCTIAWAFTGVAAIVLYPHLGHPEESFGAAARDLLPIGLVGLMLASLMAAVMSTCDAFMVDSGALYARNLYRPVPSVAYWLPGLPLFPFVLYAAYVNARAAGGWHAEAGVLLLLGVFILVAQLYLGFYLKRARARGLPEENQHLMVGRLISTIIVAGGISFAVGLPSVARGLQIFWIMSALMGPAWWLGVLWRRANRWGAWASFLAAAFCWLFTWLVLGFDTPHQMLVYLPAAFIAHIVVSLLTPPEPYRKLRDFYLLLRTPVGKEEILRKLQVNIVQE